MSGWKKSNLFRWLIITLLLAAQGRSVRLMAQASVLEEGQWLKIAVTRTGVYKLDAAFFQRFNLPVSALDPRTIRLFGNGGAPLPSRNRQARPHDLVENAIFVHGEADGRFDSGDGVYFYASSPHLITYDSTAGRLTHRINPYTDTTYYFLNVGLKPGRRMTTSSFTASNAPLISWFDDYSYHEKEQTNRVQSGREWLGDYFGGTSEVVIPFNLPGLLKDSTVLITSSVVGAAAKATRFQLKWGAQLLGAQSIPGIAPTSRPQYDLRGREDRQTFSVVPPSVESPVRLTLSYDNAGQTNAQGYLNFLAVQARRELRRYDGQFVFRSLEAAVRPAVRFLVRQADASLLVWDVTDPQQPVGLPVTLSGQDGQLTSRGGRLREFALFSLTQAYEPEAAVRIANQNLHARPTPDLLIVTPVAWRAEAERLAEFRRRNDRLDVLVATTQEIYNEFASGQPDPTAVRDAVRYWYDRKPQTLKYLLLFGDATYDYKNLTGLLTPVQLASMVPVYESRESLHPVMSYSSDDYFGFLEPEEGEWPESFSGDHSLEIGIGRIPAKSAEEARIVVDKLIRYAAAGRQPGDWRASITFVADDGDDNIHQTDAEKLARQITQLQPSFRVEKAYMDSYPQEGAPGGQKAPALNNALNRALNDGRLIINYNGHGGESGWAEEQILTLQDILSWNNERLPLLVTATCEFGRYDDPARTSGAELALLRSSGGGIGLLTTTRPVYANTNYLLNQAFYEALGRATATGAPRLGDLMRETKNNSLSGSLNRNFALLGDPSMRIAYPTAEVAITRINGREANPGSDTLRALESVQLEGEIRQAGLRLGDFNGLVKLTLYDKPITVATRGTESARMTYPDYHSLLFSGQVSVRNGTFSGRFVMPKDIDYTIGAGKLFAYAIRADSLLEAAGGFENLLIGGSADNPAVDNRPPAISLFINDTLFVDGGTVAGPDITVLAKLNDESGINIAQNGIGHELTARLNNGEPVVLNDYFVAETDDYRKGTVRTRWQNLQPGSYTVRLKAWDIYNNSAEAALNFVVSGQPALSIQRVEVAPNPFREQAVFRLQHNRPGEELEALVTIADLSGRIISERTYRCLNCEENWSALNWNGLTSGGAPVNQGLYVYRLQLRSLADGSVAVASGKVLYLR